MPVSPLAIGEALVEAAGPGHVQSDSAAAAAHAVDGRIPRWVAAPPTTEAVSRVLALATAEGLAVCPRGSGSSLPLGHPPRRLDLVLDCRRLDRMLDYVAEDMVASVGAGMCLAALAGRLESHRQRLPLDPWGGESRTVGGVLATGATGPLRFRYGGPRDLLLGVRFVQADGTITWGGARVVKSVSGYDVPKLLVGSLGTLGVITEATLRLHPVPPAAASWLFRFGSTKAAADFLAGLVLSPLEPERVALLSRGALRAAGLTSAPVAVAVGVASVPEAVASQGEALARLAREHGAEQAPAPGGFWPSLSRAFDVPVVVALAGEPTRLGAWLDELERRAAPGGVEIAAIGEARSGVLRASLTGPLTGTALRRLVEPLRLALASEDGSLVLERAPAALKAECDVWGPMPAEAFEIMRRLKRELDPAGVLNPGRFVGGL
jgi:glycolate oxidase FAD binding subunit